MVIKMSVRVGEGGIEMHEGLALMEDYGSFPSDV